MKCTPKISKLSKMSKFWSKTRIILLHVNQYLMCINAENHPTVEFFMFISITFPYTARLYETIEAWLSSWINANSTFVQYLFFVVLIYCFRHFMLTACEV